MIQQIIVFIILAGALFYTGFSIVKSLRTKASDGCGDSCSCSAKSDIHRALKKSNISLKELK